MKKYLVALIPFFLCFGLALIYGNMETKGYRGSTYPYRTWEMLSYLSSRWFVIGIVLMLLFFIFILMDDYFKYRDKKKWEKILKEDNQQNLPQCRKCGAKYDPDDYSGDSADWLCSQCGNALSKNNPI